MSKKDLSVLKIKKDFNLNNQTLRIYSEFSNSLKIITKSKPFLVAVSGGPDSLALAALSKIYMKYQKNKVQFVLIDHGIRKESSKEAHSVKKLLAKKKIKLQILKNDQKIEKNVQNHARNIRYNLLIDYCKKKKIQYILTAHHSEDQIETFFIRLSRGSGVQGLSSMNKITKLNNNIRLLRPLLDQRKFALSNIAKEYFGKFFKDPSNANKRYLRTRVRDLKNQLEKSGIRHEQIIKSINNLASTRDTLNDYLLRVKQKAIIKKKKNFYLDITYLSKETREIFLRVLGDTIRETSKSYYPPRASKVLKLLNTIEEKREFKVTLGGCIISRKRNLLFLCRENLKKKI